MWRQHAFPLFIKQNLLLGEVGRAQLSYDPLGRLLALGGTATVTRFSYDSDSLIAEYDANNALTRRYVHGAGSDAPLLWYEGSGTTNRRWLLPDERGSIVALADDAGQSIMVNSYDDFGIPGYNNMGRFQYTGQAWLPELGIYHYKARMYSATRRLCLLFLPS